MTRPVLLIPVLAILTGFFGWKTYEAWTGPLEPAARKLSGASAAASLPRFSTDNVTSAKDLSLAVSMIAVRPLFRPDRRPYEEALAGAAAPPQRNYEAELARLTVLGILILEGERKAIVTGRGAGKAEHYEVGPGDPLPGFAVKEVRADGVVLVADGKDFLLPLYSGSPTAQQGAGPMRTDVPNRAAAGASPAPAPGSAGPAAQPPAVPGRPPAARPTTPPANVPPVNAPVVSPAQTPVSGDQQPDFSRSQGRTRPYYVPGRR